MSSSARESVIVLLDAAMQVVGPCKKIVDRDGVCSPAEVTSLHQIQRDLANLIHLMRSDPTGAGVSHAVTRADLIMPQQEPTSLARVTDVAFIDQRSPR